MYIYIYNPYGNIKIFIPLQDFAYSSCSNRFGTIPFKLPLGKGN